MAQKFVFQWSIISNLYKIDSIACCRFFPGDSCFRFGPHQLSNDKNLVCRSVGESLTSQRYFGLRDDLAWLCFPLLRFRRLTFPQSSKRREKWRRTEVQLTCLLPSSPGGRRTAPLRMIMWLMRHSLLRVQRRCWLLPMKTSNRTRRTCSI